MTKLKYRDQDLAWQPYHNILSTFHSVCRSKNISMPFSESGFESVIQVPGLLNTLVDGFAAQFNGQEAFKAAYKSCTQHAINEHHNKLMPNVNPDGSTYGYEGYGPTAITGNFNAWTRLSPVITAGYLARARSLELFQIMHDDKPTFWRQYTVQYMQKGLEGERLVLPKAIRAGKVAGMLDLPLCEPADAGSDSPNVLPYADTERLEIGGVPVGVKGMIKTGTVGNILEESQWGKGKYALERAASIDYILIRPPDALESDKSILVRTKIERDMKTGKTSERMFNQTLSYSYTKETVPGTPTRETLTFRVVAIIDLDTGAYHVMEDGSKIVQAVHFRVRVTNVANEMETLMNGQDQYIMNFDVENKIYGSIPIIPEMTADFNAGGEGVSWVAYMTDQMTENYAGIRDNDLEEFIDDSWTYKSQDFELAFKLGGFKFAGTYALAARHPGGSDDPMAPSRIGFKSYLNRVFTRTEKYTNFDKNIERQWILMANDENVDIFAEVSWQQNSAEFTGGEGDQSFRYGFSLDDAYGWVDNYGRKVRIIGCKDERWVGRDIWAIQKTTTLAAPTTLYFPYMFRVMSSISPDMRNRPALLFASRDAKRVSTMVQARIKLEGNNLNLYNNTMAFAAGFKKADLESGSLGRGFGPDTVEGAEIGNGSYDNVFDLGEQDVFVPDGIPPISKPPATA